MKKILYLSVAVIGVSGICEGMLENSSPYITFHKKSGALTEAKMADVNSTIFGDMSPQSLEMIKRITQLYISYVESTSVTSHDKDDEFTADDAFFAVNGVKMQLKSAISSNPSDREKLLDDAISSLNSIKERGYYNVLGLKYCWAILCIHFKNRAVSVGFKEAVVGNVEEYGLQLMSIAAKSKSLGGDDDSEAASYLQYYKK
ncbi:MAG: hypothetical protein LBI95_01765 [Holosporales bacterium]|nr:hypothetical protein [Holosporales bacterium]